MIIRVSRLMITCYENGGISFGTLLLLKTKSNRYFFIERICFVHVQIIFLKLNDHKHSTFTITREQNYDTTAHETLNNTGG